MIDPSIIRQHVETDVSDDAISRLITDAVFDVGQRLSLREVTGGDPIGAGFDDTSEIICKGGQSVLRIPQSPRVFISADSFDEYNAQTEEWTTLDETDIHNLGPMVIQRRSTGANPPLVYGLWAPIVKVVYNVRAQTLERVVIDLVRLALQYNALKTERAGDYASESLSYQSERDALIAGLYGYGVS